MTVARVLAPYFPPAVDGGGPIRTLDALTRAAPSDVDVTVVTRDRDLGAVAPLDAPAVASDDAGRTVHRIDGRRVAGLVRLVRTLRSLPAPDVEYLNSVFDARFSIVPLVLHRLHLLSAGTIVLAPRGEFDPGALRLSRHRKRAYLALAAATGVFRTVCWHASTPLEADNIRAVVGSGARVVVRENETRLPERSTRPRRPRSDRLELVTVGRISPKKRLHLLIEALGAVHRPVRLTVVGPADDDAYARRCRDAASRLPAHVSVRFTGSCAHDAVLDEVRRASALVTATAGENFGHTIAEALATARPVLLSDTTPWSDRVRAGGGSVVPDDGWSAAIDQWAGFDDDELDRRSAAAADVYDAWRAGDPAPHLFTLVTGVPSGA